MASNELDTTLHNKWPDDVIETAAIGLFDEAQSIESRDSEGFIRRFWNEACNRSPQLLPPK
jgi:hypothetical protein